MPIASEIAIAWRMLLEGAIEVAQNGVRRAQIAVRHGSHAARAKPLRSGHGALAGIDRLVVPPQSLQRHRQIVQRQRLPVVELLLARQIGSGGKRLPRRFRPARAHGGDALGQLEANAQFGIARHGACPRQKRLNLRRLAGEPNIHHCQTISRRASS